MAQIPEDTNGPLTVALYALHDREFFEALIKDPDKVLDKNLTDKLSLTNEDRDAVIRMITEANKTDWKPMDKWKQYHQTGLWKGGWQIQRPKP